MVQLDPVLPIFFPTYKFVPSDTVGPIPAKLLPYFTISPKWHSGTCLLCSSSLVVQWGPPLPNFFPTCKFIPGGTVGLTPALVLPYFTISFLVVQWDLPPHYFFPSGTVGPTPAKLLPYMQIRLEWHSGTHLCPSSFLLQNFIPSGTAGSKFFPTYKFIPGGTVRPIPAKFLPYFTMSSIVTQLHLPPCLFFRSGTVGPTPAKRHPFMQIHPWWHSGTHLCQTSSLYFTINSLVVQWM